MKKLFLLTAIFALAFTACERTNNGTTTPPALTIRNESSFDFTDVRFSGVSFAAQGSTELPRQSSAVRQLGEENINTVGYITFTRKDIGIVLRTAEPVTITNHSEVFTFLDSTLVVEVDNPDNRDTLSQIALQPKLIIEYQGALLTRNGSVNFGEAVINNNDRPRQADFVMRNTGAGELVLNGSPLVSISGGAGAFSVVQPPVRSGIASGESLPFSINFIPNDTADYAAAVSISSNDQDGDYNFTLAGTGVPPKPIASVLYEGREIAQNGAIDAGEVIVTRSKEITVVIKNNGADTLTLGAADISGTNAAAFAIETNPSGSISAGGQSSFVITFSPVDEGMHNAVLTIPTNDDSRNPIIIELQARAVYTYGLTIAANPTNGGTVTPASPVNIDSGAPFSISASPAIGYEFDNWTVTSGTATISNPTSMSTTVTLSSDTTIIANFKTRLYTLNVDRNHTAGGTTTPSQQHSIPHGTSVTISASPANDDYRFDRWTVANGSATFENANSANTTVTLLDNTTIVANFLKKTYEDFTFTYLNSGNWTFPNRVRFPATVEVYALGAGGGGQGGHYISYIIQLNGPTIGSGGAGGGGAAAYMKFEVEERENFTIEVGKGGNGSNRLSKQIFSGWESASPGTHGEDTEVTWPGGTLTVRGGRRGSSGTGSQAISGGAGGVASTRPSAIAEENWESKPGGAGGNGSSGSGSNSGRNTRSGGASAALNLTKGWLQFNDDVNENYSGGWLDHNDRTIYSAGVGGGGYGGYGDFASSAGRSGGTGGHGLVKIRVTWYE